MNTIIIGIILLVALVLIPITYIYKTDREGLIATLKVLLFAIIYTALLFFSAALIGWRG